MARQLSDRTFAPDLRPKEYTQFVCLYCCDVVFLSVVDYRTRMKRSRSKRGLYCSVRCSSDARRKTV